MSGLEPTDESTVAVDRPVDFRTDEKEQVLFFLAKHVPVSSNDLAEEGVQNVHLFENTVPQRFEKEIRLDSTGFIQLTDAARPYLLRAAKSHIETARNSLESGKRLMDEGEFESAAARFKRAAAIASDVRGRLKSVSYDPKQLDEFVGTAKQRHDVAAKESTKDSVNYLVLEARQHESTADDLAVKERERAEAEYSEAEDNLRRAIRRATDYNDCRLSMNSNKLSIENLKSRLKGVVQKRQPDTGELGGEEQQTTVTDDTATDTSTTEKPTREALLEEIERLTDTLEKVPSAKEMQEHGTFDQHRYDSTFGSWNDAVDASDIDAESKFLSDLRRVGEIVQKRPTTSDVEEYGQYRPDRIRDHFGSLDAAVDELEIDTSSSTEADGRNSTEARSREFEELDPSALETSWESIPRNDRTDGQLLVYVEEVRNPRGDKKTHLLQVSDRLGNEFKFDIWKTHNLRFEWEENRWFAVSDARGSAWEADAGETKKRLSSTKDLEVVKMGADFDPTTVDSVSGQGEGRTTTTSEPTTSSGRTSTPEESESSSGSSRTAISTDTVDDDQNEETEVDDEIFDDILSEFDDMSG